MRNIKKLINMNESKALLISATGERDIIVTGQENTVKAEVLVV